MIGGIVFGVAVAHGVEGGGVEEGGVGGGGADSVV